MQTTQGTSVYTDDGRETKAMFRVEKTAEGIRVVVISSGGAAGLKLERSREFSEGGELLVKRLGALGAIVNFGMLVVGLNRPSGGGVRPLFSEQVKLAEVEAGEFWATLSQVRSHAGTREFILEFSGLGGRSPLELERYLSMGRGDVVLATSNDIGGGEAGIPPTADAEELAARVSALLRSGLAVRPLGQVVPKKRAVATTAFERDPQVIAFVLQDAGGRCEACGATAPFATDDGRPFLEVHHLKRLADGGTDTVENAVAVCPNCHRRLHYSSDRVAYRSQVISRVVRLKPE